MVTNRTLPVLGSTHWSSRETESTIGAQHALIYDAVRSEGKMASEMKTRNSPSQAISTVPVVGVGASAGGLEMFQRLLSALPVDTGFAFVAVQHLDPNHRSLLAEILGRSTSMPVLEASDRVKVEPDHVYVIPPNIELTIKDGLLHLAPRPESPGFHMPIDRFFASLADECGSRAICIVLSGTGSDGSAGVEAVKAAGGITFAQDASSAKYASMPESAVATKSVDFVLSPEDISKELVRIAHHPYLAEQAVLDHDPSLPDDEKEFGAILASLLTATGIDFSHYREKMVKRRILRRLALRNVNSLAEYAALVAADKEEVIALQFDLLISVTSFFRDPEAFDALKKKVFPKLCEGRGPNETIRIWVAGCATGEEAFSVAIALQEFQTDCNMTCPVQIFASDISQPAIDKARLGKYAANAVAELSPERLQHNFDKVDDGYVVVKALRDQCVFARHNLIDDPPFSKLDLISCRNVLIYLGNVQQKIIPLFHFALKPNGFLFLGASEAPAAGELFSVVDRDHQIYAKRAAGLRANVFTSTNRSPRLASSREAGGIAQPADSWAAGDVRKEVDRILLSRYSPAGIVVDEGMDVVETRGKLGGYLTFPVGKVSFHLIKVIADAGLFLEVEKLILRARETELPTSAQRVPYLGADGPGLLNIEAILLDTSHSKGTLVLFEPVPQAVTSHDVPGDVAKNGAEPDPRDTQIVRLRKQLEEARNRFLHAIDAQQSSREESQNTTEEALSANEELQSLNEELETAKEELQSTNEELTTVNEELHVRNTAVSQARDFAMSIVETVRQPLVVLDPQLRIRMANRAFYRVFRTSSRETVGQEIFAFGGGAWDLPGLRDAIESLIAGATAFPDFEVEQDFQQVGLRNLVIGGCRMDHRKLILLAVDDITDTKVAELTVRRSEEHARESQKLEAVGRLAGGIAHDFNNLLTAILGYSSLLADSLPPESTASVQVNHIRSAGERAAALTSQLLAFSRRQVLTPKLVALNPLVQEFGTMLGRLLAEQISIEVAIDEELWPIRADAGELGRAIMNLSLNARDAMPHGGTLTLQTDNVTIARNETLHPEIIPGRYVRLMVRDTGVGIDADTRSHMFEPFFTTKMVGKGTGLGLATVLGIVQQSGGEIVCESKVGAGTSFLLFFPAVEADARLERDALTIAAPVGASNGAEVVLLVEDEPIVRSLSSEVLIAHGYTVHEASNGRAALKLYEAAPFHIDILVTDIIMPELGGRQLAERLKKLTPGLKCLFMSGHTEDIVLKQGIQGGIPFLRKPYLPTELVKKVRETLDAEQF